MPTIGHPDRETRFRLMTLDMPSGPVEFGGGLACVRAQTELRSRIAGAIAAAVIGPRPPEIDGTVEIAGRFVTLRLLPAPLLGPRAASTVDVALLDELWRDSCARRRTLLDVTLAAQQLERDRVEAAFERAAERVRVLEQAALAAPAPPVAPDPPADDVTPRLVALLATLDDLGPVPVPAALALADAFDELAARPASPPPAPVDVDLAAVERRVADARLAVAHAAGGVGPTAQVRIDTCHRAVVEAERNLFEAGRRERPAALARYQEALGDERSALAEAGVESYASFLVAMAAGAAPVNLEDRLRAELELAQAEAHRDEARGQIERSARDERADRERELRAEAVALLGRVPSDDPASELRSLREEHPDAAPARDELRAVLATIGVTASADVVDMARDVVRARRAAPVEIAPEPAAPARAPEATEEEQTLRAQLAALERERVGRDEEFGQIAAELAELDVRQSSSVADLDLDAISVAIGAVLDRYRAAELLAGRLPLVLDGALDQCADEVVIEVAAYLAGIVDVQVIVITDRLQVADAMGAVGAATILWPGGEASELDDLAGGLLAMPCRDHLTTDAVADCVRCGRPSCLDCLVYVPGEPELWCVDCVEAERKPNLRLLRRRKS